MQLACLSGTNEAMDQSRFEFKYALDSVTAIEAKNFVGRLMKPDPHAKNGFYTVTSLYFDTPLLSDYYDKSGGFLARKKLRARIYEPYLTETTDTVWLEIKRKFNMSFVKSRVPLSRTEWDDLLAGKFTRLLSQTRTPEAQKTLEEFIWDISTEGRQPLFFIRYKRYPFLAKDNSSCRITFDEHIETWHQGSLRKPLRTELVRPRTSVMEVKFTESLPAWFGILRRQLHLTRVSFSKYAISVDALNKYNPLPR